MDRPEQKELQEYYRTLPCLNANRSCPLGIKENHRIAKYFGASEEPTVLKNLLQLLD
jgi:hypothetical protein